jgi:hypothetical protein
MRARQAIAANNIETSTGGQEAPSSSQAPPSSSSLLAIRLSPLCKRATILAPPSNANITRRAGPQLCDHPEHGYQCGTAISHSWGQYSPYFSVPSEIDAAVPQGCEVTFAQILSRHGARAPTFKRAVEYINVLDKIHNDAIYYSPAFNFLQTYEYELGAEQLTEMGQQQMVNSGLKFYRRYRTLARTSAPFIRAGDQERVVHSAQNFTQGFHSALLADRKSTVRAPPPHPHPAQPPNPPPHHTRPRKPKPNYKTPPTTLPAPPPTSPGAHTI